MLLRFFKKERKLPQHFLDEYQSLTNLQNSTTARFSLSKVDFFPCLSDKTTFTGFDRHYVYHPAWAARMVKNANPTKHIDISSTLHFSSILSAFISTEFYDYRPANLILSNLKSLSADLLNLPFQTNSVESISCMHTVEHVGLGRYGDSLDYDGDLKAISELKRVTAVGGMLLFVVPLGNEPKIYFNAHRVYTKNQILSYFGGFSLKEFALIPEDERDGGLIPNPGDDLLAKQVYGCGCFCFMKNENS
jgi:SAM-dependent methyltransferase